MFFNGIRLRKLWFVDIIFLFILKITPIVLIRHNVNTFVLLVVANELIVIS